MVGVTVVLEETDVARVKTNQTSQANPSARNATGWHRTRQRRSPIPGEGGLEVSPHPDGRRPSQPPSHTKGFGDGELISGRKKEASVHEHFYIRMKLINILPY